MASNLSVDNRGEKDLFRYAESVLQDSQGLQNLDNLREKSVTSPCGVIALCVKQLTVMMLDTNKIFGVDHDVTVYLRIIYGSQVKYTHGFENAVVPFCLLIDVLHHFRASINKESSTDRQELAIELIMLHPARPKLHTILGSCKIHLFDIIGCTVDNRKIPIQGNEISGHLIANVDIEFCFSYGQYGYGFSNQLLHKGKTPFEQLNHSMFFRSEPPIERADILNDVIQCRPVARPKLLKLDKKPDKENPTILLAPNIMKKDNIYPLLTAKMEQSLESKSKQYHKIKSVKERLLYLENLVSNTNQHTFLDENNFTLKQESIVKMKSCKSGEAGYEISNINTDQNTTPDNSNIDEPEKGLFKNMRRRLSSLVGYSPVMGQNKIHPQSFEYSLKPLESVESKESDGIKKAEVSISYMRMEDKRQSIFVEASNKFKNLLGLAPVSASKASSIMIVEECSDSESNSDIEI